MYPVVFSAAWFVRYQLPLLTALNAPVIGGELRDALGIRRHDVGGDPRRRIVRLLPHAYVVANPDGTFTLDVRTHAKYAKRLRRQFLPLWNAAHAWDRFVANPLVPALNLGFDTLTAFPDPNPETTTVDGYAYQDGLDATWATLRGSAGNNFDDLNPSAFAVVMTASTTTNQWARLFRGLFLFDTSSLRASATVTAAVLSLYGSTGPNDGLSATPNIDIYTSAPASNTSLAGTDYATFGAVSQTGTPITSAGWTNAGYNDFTFNATGRGNINPTSVSKFGTRNANYDVANTAPPWVSGAQSFFEPFCADQAGSANDPKLVVTFVGPSGIISSRTRPRPFAPGIAR